jgi:N-acetylglucosamine malate deacetylase 1
MSKRILCLHAHPDDPEILAGGTLALLAAAGHKVLMVTMTSGDCGSDQHSADEISDIRRSEAARSAALIGADYFCLGFHDMVIFNDDASRRKVTAALRRHRPDIILTASPLDYHADHEATSILVRDACFAASAPNYGTASFDPSRALPAIPHLYFVDPVDGVDRDGRPQRPHFVVDVASVFDTKTRMLSQHESQRAWLKRQHSMDDFLEQMTIWCKQRGALAGIEYGEGFRHYTGHPWPADPALESLLGEALVKQPLAAAGAC